MLKISENAYDYFLVFLLLVRRGNMYLFCFNIQPMQLMMYLGNDLIDAISVDLHLLSQPGYLGKFKRVLKNKHAELIQESAAQPEFLVVDLNPAETTKTQHNMRRKEEV